MCTSPPALFCRPALLHCAHALSQPGTRPDALASPWFASCRPQLANVLNTEQLFYTCIFPFIAFFGAFAFVLYPLKDQLHPTGERGAFNSQQRSLTAASWCHSACVPCVH